MTRLNRGSTKYNQLRISNRQMASFFAQGAAVIVNRPVWDDMDNQISFLRFLWLKHFFLIQIHWTCNANCRNNHQAFILNQIPFSRSLFWPSSCYAMESIFILAGFIDLPKDWLWWILLKLNINEYQTLTFEPCPIHVDISSADFKKF